MEGRDGWITLTPFGFGFGGNRRQCPKPKHTSFRFPPTVFPFKSTVTYYILVLLLSSIQQPNPKPNPGHRKGQRTKQKQEGFVDKGKKGRWDLHQYWIQQQMTQLIILFLLHHLVIIQPQSTWCLFDDWIMNGSLVFRFCIFI